MAYANYMTHKAQLTNVVHASGSRFNVECDAYVHVGLSTFVEMV